MISFIRSKSISGSGATQTLSFNVTSGQSKVLVVAVYAQDAGSGGPDSVTFNGVDMTFVTKDETSGRGIYFYLMVNPPTGTHNIVAHAVIASPTLTGVTGLLYTGVDQSNPTDGTGTNHGSTGVPSVSVTISYENSWGLMFFTGAHSPQNFAILSLRGLLTSDLAGVGDTNGIVAPGTQTFLGAVSQNNWNAIGMGLRADGSLTPDGTIPTYLPSIITAVNRSKQNLPFPQFVIGGQSTDSRYALFKKSTSTRFTVWRSPVYSVGTDFDVTEIVFNLLSDLDMNSSIIPILYFDDESTISVGTVINSTNYSNEDKLIALTALNFNNGIRGKSNFFLELQFTGSTLATVGLPIFITTDILNP